MASVRGRTRAGKAVRLAEGGRNRGDRKQVAESQSPKRAPGLTPRATLAGIIAPRLILASASPRRAQILRDAGFSFSIRATSVDESLRRGKSARTHVERLAREKARTAAKRIRGDAIVIGADTVVVVGGKILGKPRSLADARRMLRLLSGRKHRVLTGVAVLLIQSKHSSRTRGVRMRSEVESTTVTFARLSTGDIEMYVATGEPNGKAGGYAIQGRAGRFITRIDGCYFNVVGLPIARLHRMLRELIIRRD